MAEPIQQDEHGARRRRPALLTLTALGTVAAVLGVAGVFAVGSDRATTGTNDVRTGVIDDGGGGGEDTAVDLQLTTATLDELGVFTCGTTWTDDLATGVITSGGADLSTQYPGIPELDEGYLCIRNVGTAAATVNVSTFEVVDTELACSPGEADVDDTCGSGQGELANDLGITFYDANDPQTTCLDNLTAERTVSSLSDGPMALVSLSPGQVRRLCPDAVWRTNAASQSDQVSWRFRFDADEIVHPACWDQYEPNDGQGHAAGALDNGGTYAAVACPGEQDWYSVGSGSETVDTFSLDWSGPANLDLTAYDSEGNVLATSAATSGNHEGFDLAPNDVWYLKVTSVSGPQVSYDLSLSS